MSALHALLEDACRAGHPPAAQACVIHEGRVVHESAHGASPDGVPTSATSVFDVASVTKVAATTLSIAVLIARGELALDAPVARWLPAFGANGKGEVTLRAVLGHRSGLPAWAPLFQAVIYDARTSAIFARREVSEDVWAIARGLVLAQVHAAPLETPHRRVYSDLGFLALGALVEEVTGTSLDGFARAHVFAPLGLDLAFVDRRATTSPFEGRHVLPTGRTRPREPAPGQCYVQLAQPLLFDPGHVDDDNAFAMGGVAGHAGLFGTASALARLGWALVEELEGAERLGIGEVLRTFATIDPAEGAARGLGFDMPAALGSSVGDRFGKRGPRGAIGHLGFTGCSLWIDLDRALVAVLLTNRTVPGRTYVEPIRALRRAFHDAACDAIEGG